ncbi:MAG: bifunctional precorrin-2 dehydrogenase/sirohydrochlorin ferrochelatase [Candidatus Bathyarchaeia archaeon]
MLVDLKLNGKQIIVVGGGSEAYRKALNFVNSGAEILFVSKSFSENIKSLSHSCGASLLITEVHDAATFIGSLQPKPDLLVAATNDKDLNTQLVYQAKKLGCLAYSVDNPSISDFSLPAVTKVGDVQIAVSTSGKSPAMARTLRKRIAHMIKEEDLLKINLQAFARSILKEQVYSQKVRRQLLYELLNHDKIMVLLKGKKLDEAQKMTVKILESRIKELDPKHLPRHPTEKELAK